MSCALNVWWVNFTEGPEIEKGPLFGAERRKTALTFFKSGPFSLAERTYREKCALRDCAGFRRIYGVVFCASLHREATFYLLIVGTVTTFIHSNRYS